VKAAAALLAEGNTIPFIARYRKERTGAAFMDLARPGTIKGKCAMNALITLKEYLDDFASAEVKRSGYRLIADAREKGYAETLLGRRRFLRDIVSRNATSRQAAERNAINTPVQGTAADLIKLAMVRVHRELKQRHLKTRMVLQIHDELLFDVPKDEVGAVRDLVKQAMTTVLDIGVPLEVSVGVGDTWLEAH
jgi:DNA polymerase-1